MAKPQGEREQWERRTGMIFVDQHGRKYSVEIDKEAMAPVSPLSPHDFKQPVPTPPKYLKIFPERLGYTEVDYQTWKRDLLAAGMARTTKMRKLAEDMYGAAFGKMMENPPPELLAKVGPGPIPIEFVLAMEAGKSPWALGLRKPGGGYYPKPKWVTPSLEEQLLSALRTTWSGDDANWADLPVAQPGQFEDDEVLDAPIEAAVEAPAFVDEEEVVEFARPSFAPPPPPPPPRRGRPVVHRS